MSVEDDSIRITAEPQSMPQNCLYRVDRSIFVGTIYVSDLEIARQWVPLAAALMESTDGIRGIKISNTEILITMQNVPEDWRVPAKSSGSAIRAFLLNGSRAVEEKAAEHLAGDDQIRAQAQTVVDEQLNPGLASHGGWVEIVASDGKDLYLSMGGGCQGCGSAAATMTDGVEASLRNAVPDIGAIHDATDHAAGVSPYM
jgi:Fe-S cluster biogenesis protein NfuA